MNYESQMTFLCISYSYYNRRIFMRNTMKLLCENTIQDYASKITNIVYILNIAKFLYNVSIYQNCWFE